MVKAFGLDDWFMAGATVFFAVYGACSYTASCYGLGRHEADLTHDAVVKTRFYWWLCYIWYDLQVVFSRLSIGCFFLRLTVKKWHRHVIFGLIFSTVFQGIAFIFVTFLQCIPLARFWDKSSVGACWDDWLIRILLYIYGVCTLLMDLSYTLLPVFIIIGLQMDRRTKIALVPILGLGCVASVAVIVRFFYIHSWGSADFTWDNLDTAIWTIVEPGLGITAGNLVTLRPILTIILRTLGLSTTPSNYHVSDDAAPRTIGAADQSKGRKASRHSLGFENDVELDETQPARNSNARQGARKPSSAQGYRSQENLLEPHPKHIEIEVVDEIKATPTSFLPGAGGTRRGSGSTSRSR
ncbi:Uu.00g034280.m01.CDS01 [Anthostomella pinea]|uniref:Uu.00g034280.m01.CDS01 n=1 Tax=Anthostomella pinea TaxID=933095 RepID=A0AAI8VA10_9PEZI|nr:Uu.00g034280.m01.CDS01 [Anthostomella pinea]